MRIAFTHNLQRSPGNEEEAEFDTQETVNFICSCLEKLGHDVTPIEVSGSPAQTITELERVRPELVFNTAEGRRGRYREAFFPGLFEELGLPYTGSDPQVCGVTLDKHLSKLIVSQHGVRTPKWLYVHDLSDLSGLTLKFPIIVKPNFEGSSKGITQDSVVEDEATLRERVGGLLARYSSGLILEEYIFGRDVVVPFLEKASTETGGVLAAAEYDYDLSGRKYRIYDYDLKQVNYAKVSVRVPAQLSSLAQAEIRDQAQIVFRALGIRDLGRIDFRIADDGTLYFIEVNALPSLEQGAAIFEAAKLAGLVDPEQLFAAVVASAVERERSRNSVTKAWAPAPLVGKARSRVGLAYNLKRIKPRATGADDDEAEFDSRETIDQLRAAIESLGHEVIELEADRQFPARLLAAKVDVVFNIAEGRGGKNREAQVPALLELMEIPCTGADSAALTVSLDKALAKRVVAAAGVRTPAFIEMITGHEPLPAGFRWPAVVKPVAEGSSKGVLDNSVVFNEGELRSLAAQLIARYKQPALIEEYLPGREFTVGIVGNPPRVLPAMEVVFTEAAGPNPLYTIECKLDWVDKVRYEVPANVTPELALQLGNLAKLAFTALGCRDVGRVDFRLDIDGQPSFIECNPLPGLSPGWSDLCLIAEAAGMTYTDLVSAILNPALARPVALARAR